MDTNTIPSIIKRDLPSAVTYDLSTPGSVKITLPPTSTWSSGLHWHETHVEYLKVVRGSVRVRLGDTWQTVTAENGEQPEVRVDRYVWHEWQRAEPGGDEVVVVERTDPVDNEKAVFFWNLNGVILNAPKLLDDHTSLVSRLPSMFRAVALDFWITLNLFVIFHYMDNFPVFANAPSFTPSFIPRAILVRVDWLISHFALYFASWIGWALGLQPARREYTPPRELATWWDQHHQRAKGA